MASAAFDPSAGGSVDITALIGPMNLTNTSTPTGTNALNITNNSAATSGDSDAIFTQGTFNPTSGNANFCGVEVNYTVNQTGGANGQINGLKVDATETAVVGVHNLLLLRVGGLIKFVVNNAGGVSISPTGFLAVPSGSSLSSVAVQVAGDQNTGLGQISGADTISFVAAGREHFRVTDAYSGFLLGATTSHTIQRMYICNAGNGVGDDVSLVFSPAAGGFSGNPLGIDGVYLGSGNGYEMRYFTANDAGTRVEVLRMTGGTAKGVNMLAGRFALSKGADVPSAGTLTLGNDGTVFGITGTTPVDYITTTNWQAGSIVTLRFAAAAVLNNNTGSVPANTKPILTATGANVTYAANAVVQLLFDGNNWIDLKKIS